MKPSPIYVINFLIGNSSSTSTIDKEQISLALILLLALLFSKCLCPFLFFTFYSLLSLLVVEVVSSRWSLVASYRRLHNGGVLGKEGTRDCLARVNLPLVNYIECYRLLHAERLRAQRRSLRARAM